MSTQRTAERRTVLVVDDEAVVREVAGLLLEAGGYGVLAAATSDEALELAAANPVDAVLLDLMLPGRPGAETVSELRRARPGVPVVVASGYDEDTVSERLEGVADLRFLRKPYTAEDLLGALAAALAA